MRGQRHFAAEQKEENFHRIERRFGSFVRAFSLPQTVDAGSVTAKYEHGVLDIELKKKEAAKPKQIKIELGASANGQQSRQVEGVSSGSSETVRPLESAPAPQL